MIDAADFIKWCTVFNISLTGGGGGSINLTAGNNIVLTPSPITSAGSIALNPIITAITNIRTGLTVGSSYVLQGYDVDDTAYKDFITIVAGNTPSCSIGRPNGGSLNIDGATIGGNVPVTISQATSIATNALTIATSTLTQRSQVSNSSSAVTVDLDIGADWVITLNAATPVITLPVALAAATTRIATLTLVQDGTGGRIPSFVNATYAAGVAPSIALGAGEKTYLSLYCNSSGTVLFANSAPISYGTYTPTLTNTLNVSASTAYPCQWMRIGSTVTVSGMVDVDPTAVSVTELDISLPVASNFTQVYQAGGSGSSTTTTNEAVGIIARTSTSRAFMSWLATELTNHQVTFNFTYQIIP